MARLGKWNPSRALEKFRHELDDLLKRFPSERGWLKEWERFRYGRQWNHMSTTTNSVFGSTCRVSIPAMLISRLRTEFLPSRVRARKSVRLKSRIIFAVGSINAPSSAPFRCPKE
jgi:hypothetical protein